MGLSAKRDSRRVLSIALLFCAVAALVLMRRTNKRPPISEPPVDDDATQPVRPARRSMEERELDTQKRREEVRRLQEQYPPVVAGEA